MTNALSTGSLPGRYSTAPLQPRRDRVRAIYRKAVFALDARRTPGSSAAGNTIQDLSSNALRTQNGTTGNAKIVQDGRGGKALRTHGSATGFASTPDSAATSVTSGVLGIRAWFRHNSWAPSANEWVLGKWIAGTNQRSYGLGVSGTTGRPFLSRSLNGTAGSSVAATANLAAAQPDGWYGIGVDRDPATGTCTFFESSDGVTWTQLGSPVADTAGNLFDGTASLVVGVLDASGPLNGLVGWVKVYDDSTLVADFDPSRDASFSSLSWASSTTGETWTVTPGGSDNSDATYLPAPSTLGVTRYVYSPRTSSVASVAESAAITNITGDIDIRVRALPESMGSGQGLATKYHGTVRTWRFSYSAAGTLTLTWSPDNISSTFKSASATFPYPTSPTWFRATLDVDNGAGGHTVRFYTSSAEEPGVGDWTQVGTDLIGAGTTSLPGSAGALWLGTDWDSFNYQGSYFRAQVYDGIDGTKVFDWSAEDTVNSTHTTYTASTGQTVTVNRATSGRKTVVVEAAKWLLGTDDYIEVADNALLDLDAATDFTVLAVLRQHATPGSYRRYVSKESTSLEGWFICSEGTTQQHLASVGDPADADAVNENGTLLAAGDLRSIGFRWSRTGNVFQAVTNGTLSTGDALTAMGDVSSATPMRIGTSGAGVGNYSDFELYAIYIWREALTASELAAIAADWGAA